MSTQLTERPDHWLVSTVTAPGTRRKIPRQTVRVPKGNKEVLIGEMVRQAKAARLAFALPLTSPEPVV